MKQYEAMFVLDPTFASEITKAKGEIQRILDRSQAEITFLERWEERKLAYEIKGRKRGCYMLTYFKCAGDKIGAIERDAQLSEPVLRVLITSAEGVTREHIDRFMPQVRTTPDERPPATPEASAKPRSEEEPAKAPDTESKQPAPAETPSTESTQPAPVEAAVADENTDENTGSDVDQQPTVAAPAADEPTPSAEATD